MGFYEPHYVVLKIKNHIVWFFGTHAPICWWPTAYMGITSSRALVGCEGTEDRYCCGRARGVSRIGAGLGRRQ